MTTPQDWVQKRRASPDDAPEGLNGDEAELWAEGFNDGVAAERAGHRCQLPDTIQQALNSGDGVYRP